MEGWTYGQRIDRQTDERINPFHCKNARRGVIKVNNSQQSGSNVIRSHILSDLRSKKE